MDKGQYADAVTALEEVLKSDPSNAEAQKQLDKATAKLESGRGKEAGKTDAIRHGRVQQLLAEGPTRL